MSVTLSRGLVVFLMVLVIIGCALAGSYQLDPEAFRQAPSQALYQAVQLFFAEGDWTGEHEQLPLALEFARFFAPIVTLGSLLLLFAEGIWTALVNARVRFYQDHLVVVGLSDAAMVLIRNCRETGVAVVAIEQSDQNPYAGECRRMLVPVILGDGKRAEVLARARVYLAKSLISFMNDDDSNVELSLQVQEYLSGKRPLSDPPLKVILQVADMQLGDRLESYPKFFDYPQQVEVRFFNVEAQAARSLFRDHFPDVYADALGMETVHIVIVGFRALGRHVLSAALKQAHYGNHEPLAVTVLDPDAETARERFQLQCPEISLAANVRFVETGILPEEIRQNVHRLALDDATMYVACLGTDSDNLSMALAIRQMALLALLPNAPVFVGLRNSGGLARLVESGQGNPEIPDGLMPFGMVRQLMRVERVVDEQLDQLAIAIHERFLDDAGEPEVPRASHRPWGSLPEMFRNENRAQADHAETKLRAAGYRLVHEPAKVELDDLEVNRLAQMEKARWNAMQASQGWRYAAQRSDLAMLHPELKPWSHTTVAERMYDIETCRALPEILRSRLGWGARKEIVIGITGHRAHRVATHIDLVKAEVRKQLEAIRDKYPNAEFVVLSALADGSDRIVAELALEMLNARLYAALPLPYEIYKQTFGHSEHLTNKESNEEFQRFVGRAFLYFEMPLRSGGAQILERDDDVGEQARAKQYALAGAYIVSRAHELIAIWDGRDARGTGGTGDVVYWRESGQVPDVYRFPGRFFPGFAMTPPRVIYLPDEPETDARAAAG